MTIDHLGSFMALLLGTGILKPKKKKKKTLWAAPFPFLMHSFRGP